MAADIRSELTALLRAALQSVAPDSAGAAIVLERPKQASHGDFASNLALQLAKPLKLNPREIAGRLVAELPASSLVAKAEVAGAGFINFTLAPAAKLQAVRTVLAQGADYGRSAQGGGRKVQVEFVSANPTGPLHVGHGRGAAYGASLANLLGFAGWQVTREFYVNDAGRQMDILALSTWLRYLELHGSTLPFPKNAYQGDYVRDMAAAIHKAHGARYRRDVAHVLDGAPDAAADAEGHLDALIAAARRLLGDDYAYVHGFALTEQLGDARDDLAEFGVHFDCWFSEKSLFDTGLVDKAVALLESRGHVYRQDGAKWFRSTAFGDEKDRVVQRENGLYTYFASDIAYHLNKYERGFEKIVDIWGADHHGYIPRVKGAIQALGLDPARLEVALVQFAVLYRNGQKTSMSTRSGEFVTLRELRADVGNDACRFFYVLRKSDQHLDFDLDLAKSQTNENPVYYIQYAHARIASVLSQWGGEPAALAGADLAPLGNERELALCARLGEFPDVVGNAARDYAPHAIAFYLKDLAGEFHSYYNAERFLVDDAKLREARLALCLAVRQALANGLAIIGVGAPESM
ncbi:MAG: arginine--tRNA ligase [Rhodocyclaceae bacterium]|nr:MAG: arginine--tRNA ligase [Rhodocyclaceae bacterium]MBE7423464.1 arginine--tRNA ligase [Zoogloeaceae bacterium]MCK6383272.1 arginine--tRNA ligase [Rhodocyclaceae bacterium]CAG0946356.1 arginyl-tRNA synthetase [Gammaproteobacteria bacterium]